MFGLEAAEFLQMITTWQLERLVLLLLLDLLEILRLVTPLILQILYVYIDTLSALAMESFEDERWSYTACMKNTEFFQGLCL